METVRIQNGDTEKIVAIFYDMSIPPNALTGETVPMSIWRESNSEWFTGAAWQAGYTTFNMTEQAQGDYYYNFDTSGLSDDVYHVKAVCSNVGCVDPVQTGELKVGYYVDNIDAPMSIVDTVVDAIQAVTDVLPNAGALTDIDTGVNNIEAVTDVLPNAGALTDIDTGVNNIEAKLPTNEIMGSSDKTDKDDEIDAIKAVIDGLTAEHAALSAEHAALSVEHAGVSTFDPTSDEVDVGKVKGGAVSGVNDFKANVSNLDTTISSRSSHSANNARDAILSDSTPFDGAKIDAAVSSRSNHDDPDPSGHIDATISSRSSHTAANVWSVATFGTLVADIWAYATRALTEIGVSGLASQSSVDAIQTDINRLLGLSNENNYIDQTSYDGDDNLTSARVRTYSDPASVGTDDDVIATYTITAVGTGAGKFSSWKQVK